MTDDAHRSMAAPRPRRRSRTPIDAPDRAPPAAVLRALDDEGCRAVLSALTEPRTAAEIGACCDMPSSTTYQKLDRLTEAGLLEERLDLRRDGNHATRYRPAFESIEVTWEPDGLAVRIERPQRADARPASLRSDERDEG
ncbi:MAG: ArsR/SmtB family transcription factor [Haloarculaceae archaeon]